MIIIIIKIKIIIIIIIKLKKDQTVGSYVSKCNFSLHFPRCKKLLSSCQDNPTNVPSDRCFGSSLCKI